jgi:uncharacterized protein (DUF1501 family)
MLTIGRQWQRTCQGLTRRAFLQAGASSVLGLSLADVLRLRAASAGGEGVRPKAKSVVLLWLWGGPSHLDTWDLKPDAPLEYRGPFTPIATKVPGIRVCELFPKIAGVADGLTIIRSMKTGSNDHGVAGTIGLTGSIGGAVDLGGKMQSGAARPALGAIVARARGVKAGMPPFMVIGGKLHQGKKAIIGEGGGPLGPFYDAFRLEYDPVGGARIPGLQLPPELAVQRLEDRRQLLQAFDQLNRDLDLAHAGKALDEHRAQALALLTDPKSVEMFDLSQEQPETRDWYGRTRFGQSCLLARRLIERGVPFVQVNWSDHVEAEEDSGDGGWDHHYRNFQIMQDRHAPWLDQTVSAFFTDLKQRGLLDSTLVLAMGEFGRQPKINDKAGREHWEHCYSALIGGGGVRGGRVYGESDPRAEHVRTHPVTPADLIATVQHAVGITSEQAQSLNIAVNGKVVEELL